MGDLFQDDHPTLNSAFPEQPPLDDNDLIDESVSHNLVTIQDAEGVSLVQPPLRVQSPRQETVIHKPRVCSERKVTRPDKTMNLSRGQIINHKYSLKSRV